MTIKDIRSSIGLTQKEFSDIYNIPLSTLRHWEQGTAACPDYVLRTLHFMVAFDDVCSDFMSKYPDSTEFLKFFMRELDLKLAEDRPVK